MSSSRNTNVLYMRTLQIPIFSDIYELSRLTGLSTRLLYCLSMSSNNYYQTFTIPKKSGAPRIINSPSYSMSIMQKWILRNILDKIMPSNRAMAFRKGGQFGCKTNAKYHIGTLYGLSIDLKNFFPSISSKKVYFLFKNIGYNDLAASILTNICTLDGALPQGGICSPALSNLICIRLDNRLIGLCEKRGIRYTRYADDMYFSCDNKDLIKKVFPIIKKIISNEEFTINDKKTKYHNPSNRNEITGIAVVKKQKLDGYEIKAKRKVKQGVRAEIHRAIMTGDYTKKAHILGLISYIDYVENENAEGYLDSIKLYIGKCSKKIVLFEELVESYNKNLLFNDIPRITYSKDDLFDYLNDEEGIDYLSSLLEIRKEYLSVNRCIEICKFNDWPSWLLYPF